MFYINVTHSTLDTAKSPTEETLFFNWLIFKKKFWLKTHISTKTLLCYLSYILLKCMWLCWRVFSHVHSPLLIVGPKRSRRQTGWINVVVDFSIKMRKGGQKPWHRQSANKRMRCRWRGGMGKLRRMTLIEGVTEKERSWLAGRWAGTGAGEWWRTGIWAEALQAGTVRDRPHPHRKQEIGKQSPWWASCL